MGMIWRNPSLESLRSHPNFKLPILPSLDTRDINSIVDYITEYTARLISPSPQLEEEDNEVACVDMAKLLRTELRKELKNNLRNTNFKKEN